MNNDNGTEQIFLLNAAPSQSSAPTQRMGALAPPPIYQVNLDNVEDFSHVCRTCATITEFVMPIFSGEGLQNNLADKIKKHLPIQVREGDELPLVVCYQCASTLLAWHELVKCCVQADAALRAKLSSNQRKTNPPNNVTIKSNPSIQDDPPSKYIPEFSPAEPQHYRACVYCVSSHPVSYYKEHLVLNHSDLLFHCEECDTFVDRKDFIIHMSFHALQYTTDEELRRKKFNKKKKVDNTSKAENNNKTENVKTTAPTTVVPKCSPKIERPSPKPIIETEEKVTPAPVGKINKTNAQENEFSDHSDVEGFGPLPESVFEAIEDSQDEQRLTHTEDNIRHAPDTERPTDQSKKSVTSENNLTNTSICLETNNNMNNCSVVIEPMKINYCAELNIAIKDGSVINKLLPDNKTSPKSADVGDKQPNKGKAKRQKQTRKCPLCPKEYRASSSYFYHLKYFHDGSKDHECEVCGKKFGTKSSLTQHMAIHTAHYDFECNQCQKQFKSKAGLYIHEQTHKGTKLFSCNQCDSSFRWRTHLIRHMKRHAPEKGHVCDTCGRAFSVRCDLLRHARTHTVGNHTCDTCGQKFAQLRYLKVHSTKQHVRSSRRLSSK